MEYDFSPNNHYIRAIMPVIKLEHEIGYYPCVSPLFKINRTDLLAPKRTKNYNNFE